MVNPKKARAKLPKTPKRKSAKQEGRITLTPGITSMTGFAQSQVKSHGVTYFFEVKSLNHRYCEVNFRSPRELAGLETFVVQAAQKAVHRGRIDISLTVKQDADTAALRFNLPQAKGVFKKLDQLRVAVGLKEPPDLEDLLLFKDSFTHSPEANDSASLWPSLKSGFSQLFENLRDMRGKEGGALAKDLSLRLHLLRQLHAKMNQESDGVSLQTAEKIKQRLERVLKEEGLSAKVDEARLVQEVALYTERSDVKEELSRLESHFEQFETLLAGPSPAGRKMDFLVQEIHREFNTLGSKSGSINLTQLVIEAKTELERLREQVQNVE